MTDTGQVFAWGDNDHGQQGNGTTTVNRKPALVHGLEGHRVSRVSCGSSHSVCWTCQDSPSASCHEPVLFTESKDPLGASFVNNNTLSSNTREGHSDSNNSAMNNNMSNVGVASSTAPLPTLPRHSTLQSLLGQSSGQRRGSKAQRPSLARIILSLESNASKQQALQHILNALHIFYAREAVVSALTPHGGQPSSANKTITNPILEGQTQMGNENSASNEEATASNVPLASPESPSDINEDSVNDLISGGGGEAPACPNDLAGSLQTSPESEIEPSTSSDRGYTKLCSLPHGVSPSSVMVGAVISPSGLSEVSSSASIDPESLRMAQRKVPNLNLEKSIYFHVDEFTKVSHF